MPKSFAISHAPYNTRHTIIAHAITTQHKQYG